MGSSIACGEKPLKGYVNVDLKEPSNLNGYAFQAHDLRRPLPYCSGSVDEIYAKHIVEHFTPGEWGQIKYDWVRVLRKGGRLIIETPDIVRCCMNFADDKMGLRWDWWARTIYGEDSPGMRHKQGCSIPTLKRDLETAGLKVVRARYWGDDSYQGKGMDYNLRIEAVK